MFAVLYRKKNHICILYLIFSYYKLQLWTIYRKSCNYTTPDHNTGTGNKHAELATKMHELFRLSIKTNSICLGFFMSISRNKNNNMNIFEVVDRIQWTIARKNREMEIMLRAHVRQ